MKNNKALLVAFLLGAAFGRAIFREAGYLLNVATFGKRRD